MNPDNKTDDFIFAIVPTEKREATFEDVDCTPSEELDELDIDLLTH